MKYLCTSIEKIVGTILPGKHAHEKALLLINALCSENMCKGEGLKVINEIKRMHFREVFKEWKLLKAFDCSSVGAFKTSTLQAMHSVLDEHNNGLFPSASLSKKQEQKPMKLLIKSEQIRHLKTRLGSY